MSNYDFYPVKTQARFNNMKIGQFGLFYDDKIRTLIVGIITENGLKGRVIHDGDTQERIDKGLYFSTFRIGYTYDMWSMHDMKYVGRYRSYSTLDGYLDFCDTATDTQINLYREVDVLLKDKNNR